MNRPGESGDWFEDSAGGWSWFAEAVEATWPKTTVQICVVHLIRNSMRFVSYGQRKAIAAALKTVYTTPTADAAADAFEEFAKSTRTALCSTDPARHGNGLQP